jgi:hypothetical protein
MSAGALVADQRRDGRRGAAPSGTPKRWEWGMQFVLMFNQPTDVVERQEDLAKAAAEMEPWKAYMDAMVAAGVMRGGNRLAPSWTATTVRYRDGKTQVQDGPFADSKEQTAGYVVIEVPSLDEALAWAARSPSTATGSTDVRPVALPPQ